VAAINWGLVSQDANNRLILGRTTTCRTRHKSGSTKCLPDGKPYRERGEPHRELTRRGPRAQGWEKTLSPIPEASCDGGLFQNKAIIDGKHEMLIAMVGRSALGVPSSLGSVFSRGISPANSSPLSSSRLGHSTGLSTPSNCWIATTNWDFINPAVTGRFDWCKGGQVVHRPADPRHRSAIPFYIKNAHACKSLNARSGREDSNCPN